MSPNPWLIGPQVMLICPVCVLLDASLCAGTVRPVKTKMSELEAERGSLQGHARRRVASALKDPQLPESFQQSSFIGKGGGVVSCCRLLGIRSFVLKVRSWSGHNVAGSLHQNKCYSLF